MSVLNLVAKGLAAIIAGVAIVAVGVLTLTIFAPIIAAIGAAILLCTALG